MPWELPALSMVFGEREESIIPSVRPILGYVEPPQLENMTERPPMSLQSKTTAFEHAISFESKRICHLPEGDQLLLLLQKWEAVISISFPSFDVGVDLAVLSYEQRVSTIGEILGGKSVGTLRQRLGQIGQYVKWATSEAKRPPFPITAELIKNYVRHLRNCDSPHSRYSGTLEAFKFAKHVVGLDCDLGAFETAWVSGIMRAASQQRPLRKQSAVLTVKALQFLEHFLEDQKAPLVDRYATGVTLFATYARARFGDLKQISEIFVDKVAPTENGGLGYLEMMSASHKMRSTGNRLGAHLPLIAPIKGLGPTAWGVTFANVAKEVGLDLENWPRKMPLLPAPDRMGSWTDRAVTSGEVGRWIKQILTPCDFDAAAFTPHGCKATTLAMLSKYGVEADVRLALGHHQIGKGAAEVYARDTQAAPLRKLEDMFNAIRKGHFLPDQTRSGMFRQPNDTVDPLDEENSTFVTDLPLPIPAGPRSPESNEGGWSLAGSSTEIPQPGLQVVTDADTATCFSDESESSSGSDAESCATDVIEEQASSQPTSAFGGETKFYQHRKSKIVHVASLMGTSFACGRQLTPEYRQCSEIMVVESMRCQQCRKHAAKIGEGDLADLNAVVKRARRQ